MLDDSTYMGNLLTRNTEKVPGTSALSVAKATARTLSQPQKICINTRERIFVIEVSAIKYLSTSGNSTFIHQDAATLTCSMPLSEFEKVLAKQCFVRIHRSFLVNFTRVKEFRKKTLQLVLDEGDCLEVAKSRKVEVCDMLYSFV